MVGAVTPTSVRMIIQGGTGNGSGERQQKELVHLGKAAPVLVVHAVCWCCTMSPWHCNHFCNLTKSTSSRGPGSARLPSPARASVGSRAKAARPNSPPRRRRQDTITIFWICAAPEQQIYDPNYKIRAAAAPSRRGRRAASPPSRSAAAPRTLARTPRPRAPSRNAPGQRLAFLRQRAAAAASAARSTPATRRAALRRAWQVVGLAAERH